jgi:hypothetical protein
MTESTDILVIGTGDFAARIVFDLAATAATPVTVVVAGRNRARAAWIRTAAAARAVMFGRPLRLTVRTLDVEDVAATAALLDELQPKVLLQAASAQKAAATRAETEWGRMIREAGLSLTAVFQARLSVLVARAVAARAPHTRFINCCYPDVANGMIAALGLPITCGVGNVAILSNAFAGLLGATAGRLRMLAHHSTIGPWRLPPEARPRDATPPRVWLDGVEISDVHTRFADVQLLPAPVIDISGAAAVPLILALAAGQSWQGHVPGPRGLPGGYPVALRDGVLALDLPSGIDAAAAIAWNAALEARSGLIVESGRARYTGKVEAVLRRASPVLAEGFLLADLDQVHAEMATLRERLSAA